MGVPWTTRDYGIDEFIRPSLDRFLKKSDLPDASRDFLLNSAHVVLPRTLWLTAPFFSKLPPPPDQSQWSAMASALGGWLKRHPELKRLVIDLTDGPTESPHAPLFAGAFAALRTQITVALIDGQRLASAGAQHFTDPPECFSTLRRASSAAALRLMLPRTLTYESLDRTLVDSIGPNTLKLIEAIVLDFRNVETAAFEALCLLTPAMVSLARVHLIGFEIDGFRGRFNRSVRYSDLATLARPLLFDQQEPPTDEGLPNLFGLKGFVGKSDEFVASCRRQLTSILETDSRWWLRRAIDASGGERIFYPLLQDLLRLIEELAQNVEVHSKGVGILSMCLNDRDSDGFHIYVGDTGIGLARGISNIYNFRVRSDEEAASLALTLKTTDRRIRKKTLGAGGRGLQKILSILMRLRGRISIRSGSAMVLCEPLPDERKLSVKEHLFKIDGTHIHIFIPTPAPR